MTLTHGLPDELGALWSLAAISRRTDQMIKQATKKALVAGYSPDRVTEILTSLDYPLPGVDEQWLKGWLAAKNGDAVPKTPEGHAGYQDWLRRTG